MLSKLSKISRRFKLQTRLWPSLILCPE